MCPSSALSLVLAMTVVRPGRRMGAPLERAERHAPPPVPPPCRLRLDGCQASPSTACHAHWMRTRGCLAVAILHRVAYEPLLHPAARSWGLT